MSPWRRTGAVNSLGMGMDPFPRLPQGGSSHLRDPALRIRAYVEHPGAPAGDSRNQCPDYELGRFPFIVIFGESPSDLGNVNPLPASFLIGYRHLHVTEGPVIPQPVADAA